MRLEAVAKTVQAETTASKGRGERQGRAVVSPPPGLEKLGGAHPIYLPTLGALLGVGTIRASQSRRSQNTRDWEKRHYWTEGGGGGLRFRIGPMERAALQPHLKVQRCRIAISNHNKKICQISMHGTLEGAFGTVAARRSPPRLREAQKRRGKKPKRSYLAIVCRCWAVLPIEELWAQLACIGAIAICNARFTAARVAIDRAVQEIISQILQQAIRKAHS